MRGEPMQPTDTDLETFLSAVTPKVRQRDARTMVELMRRVTAQEPRLWGSILGFGEYHYRYATGREGDGPAASFAPRRSATTVYLPDGVGAHAAALARLGEHSTGVGCLYITRLEQVDLGVLEEIISTSYQRVSAATFGARAREGGTLGQDPDRGATAGS